MIKCKKCHSDLPSSYKYCIYCATKLQTTEENKEKLVKKAPYTAAQIGAVVGGFLCIVATAVLAVIFIAQ